MRPDEAQSEWQTPSTVDVSKPNVARVYDYYLGGARNFDVDRVFARKILASFPEARNFAIQNRAYQQRAVRYVSQLGVRQFLDLGSGIPTVGPTHEIARQVNPDARVVYVDIEPVAVEHSSMLLADDPNALVLQQDLRDIDAVVAAARGLLDFDQPVALMILAMLHFLTDDEDPGGVIHDYAKALGPGSYVIISHATAEGPVGDRVSEAAVRYAETTLPGHLRDRDQVAAMMAGFDLVDPAHGTGGPRIVWTPEWRPDTDDVPHPEESVAFAAVGRKR